MTTPVSYSQILENPIYLLAAGMSYFGLKLVIIAQNWTKCTEISSEKNPGFVQFLVNLTHFVAAAEMPVTGRWSEK